MKIKFLLAAALIFSLTACQSNTEREETTGHDHGAAAAHDHDAQHAPAPETGTLALNKGAKWETDESTRQHAVALQRIANSFPQGADTDLAAYQQHAREVQQELDGLIRDCRMQGPEHDALHLWLEPVLGDTRQLSAAQDAASAAQTTQRLHEDILKFSQYFN